MTQAKTDEPPSCLQLPLLNVGQDCRGNWVVQDPSGVRGGLFAGREAALRYVRSENGDRPYAFVMVSGPLELNTGGPGVAISRQFPADARRERRVA